MKKGRLLNSELSYAVSRIGHTAHITVCDAGLPIPPGVRRIDLAVEPGYPAFLRVLDALLSEMMVEEIVLAEEIREKNAPIFQGILETFASHGLSPKVTLIPHEAFKALARDSEAVVRTGECTPYANVILRSGVVF